MENIIIYCLGVAMVYSGGPKHLCNTRLLLILTISRVALWNPSPSLQVRVLLLKAKFAHSNDTRVFCEKEKYIMLY